MQGMHVSCIRCVAELGTANCTEHLVGQRRSAAGCGTPSAEYAASANFSRCTTVCIVQVHGIQLDTCTFQPGPTVLACLAQSAAVICVRCAPQVYSCILLSHSTRAAPPSERCPLDGLRTVCRDYRWQHLCQGVRPAAGMLQQAGAVCGHFAASLADRCIMTRHAGTQILQQCPLSTISKSEK